MKQKPVVTLCLAAFFAIAAHAQLATTTSLVGTVTDSSGKLIPNAKVTATETRTLDKYNTTTNEQGNYTFEFVRVGVYSVAVEQAGFQKVTKTGITVDVDQTVRTDFSLRVGAVTAIGDRRSDCVRDQDRRRHHFGDLKHAQRRRTAAEWARRHESRDHHSRRDPGC